MATKKKPNKKALVGYGEAHKVGGPPLPPEEKAIKGRFKVGNTAAHRPKAAREVIDFIRENQLPKALAKLDEIASNPDIRAQIWAVEFTFKWSLGNPPKQPVTAKEEVEGLSKEELKRQTEIILAQYALDGDPYLLDMQLRALDPKTYGPPRGSHEPRHGDGEGGDKVDLFFTTAENAVNPVVKDIDDDGDDDE